MATSKQPKQPPFPHPPLEVGVPQYPTPNVPDFYTKSGHIILVEKVSVEKGSYKPLPLDGTAVYQGRDANKWPANLYLVAERPTEDGEYAYRYWANDRTLASQNPWNYGVDYSQNATGYPIYSRTYIVPRSQYAAVSNGSADPVFGGTAIVASQRMRELPDDNPLRSRHVQVEVVYESIPGPLLGGQENSAGLLGVKTSSETTVPAGTSADTLNSTVVSSQVVPIDAVKSKKTTIITNGPFSLSGGESKSGLLGTTSLTELIVSAGTSPDELTTSVISSNVEPIDSAKSKKTTIITNGPFTLSGGKYEKGLLGDVKILESIVQSNDPPDQLSFNTTDSIGSVVESTVDPIDSAKSKKTTILSTGPYTLVGESKAGGILGETSISESIVSLGSAADTLSTTILESIVTPIDGVKAKKTTTTLTGPSSLAGSYVGQFGSVKITETIVAPSVSVNPDSLTVAEKITPIDSGKSKHELEEYSSANTLIGSEYNSYLNQAVTVRKYIVEAGTTISLSGNIFEAEVQPLDYIKSIYIVKSLDSLPDPRTEYRQGTFTHPTLIYDLRSSYSTNGGVPSVTISPRIGRAKTFYTSYKKVTTFYFGNDGLTPIDAINLETVPVYWSGNLISFDFGNCLADPLQVWDQVNGVFVLGSVTSTPSPTSATDYLNMVNTYAALGSDIDYWKSNIWVKTDNYVLLK
jgi:hypothetical protein